MKTGNLFKMVITSVMVVAFSTNLFADHLSERLLVTARLSGANVVPAKSNNANGVASFFFNETMDTLCVSISVDNLSGSITGIHVHEGSPSTPATVSTVLTNLTGMVSGNRISGTLTGADLTPAIRAKYLNGELFLNVYTSSNSANGEIRGQLKVESDYGFRAYIDSLQEVPATSSRGTGVGVFNLSIDKRELTVNVTVDSLIGTLTAAHLHWGKPGVAGPVAINLTSMINGNNIKGKISTSLPTELLQAVMNDSVYVNIHSDSIPGGEIRGNLFMQKGLAFDAALDTTQETTPVISANGYGSSYINLNASMDTLTYNIQVSGLSGPITMAHIHEGEPNVSGNVLINLTPDITTNNRIIGMKTGAALTPAIIGKMLALGTYLNVHTAANPAGEVRGQIARIAREGYDINISNVQVIDSPASTSLAVGGGIVSINRDRTNAHYMVVVSNLSGPLTAAHFHNGVEGTNGPIVYNLTPFFAGTSSDDAAFGYWTDDTAASNTTPFTPANELQFRRDSIYINIHTAVYPDGEIRGQVNRNSDCYRITVGINDLNKSDLNAKIYPNPVTDKVNIEISSADYSADATVKILDMTGQTVLSQKNINQFTTLDLSRYSTGVFFIMVETNGKRLMKKLVIIN